MTCFSSLRGVIRVNESSSKIPGHHQNRQNLPRESQTYAPHQQVALHLIQPVVTQEPQGLLLKEQRQVASVAMTAGVMALAQWAEVPQVYEGPLMEGAPPGSLAAHQESSEAPQAVQ